MELNKNLIITSSFLIFYFTSEALEMILSPDAPDDEDLEDERYNFFYFLIIN